VSHGQNVTVDITIGSKCHCGRGELGRNVQAPLESPRLDRHVPPPPTWCADYMWGGGVPGRGLWMKVQNSLQAMWNTQKTPPRTGATESMSSWPSNGRLAFMLVLLVFMSHIQILTIPGPFRRTHKVPLAPGCKKSRPFACHFVPESWDPQESSTF
jgi:hypothetical protein